MGEKLRAKMLFIWLVFDGRKKGIPWCHETLSSKNLTWVSERCTELHSLEPTLNYYIGIPSTLQFKIYYNPVRQEIKKDSASCECHHKNVKGHKWFQHPWGECKGKSSKKKNILKVWIMKEWKSGRKWMKSFWYDTLRWE